MDHNQHTPAETQHEVRNSINKKRRGGRPPLTPDERRRYKVKVGFTTSEFERLLDRAESANLPEPEFIRRICINQPIYTIPKINADALIAINRIGNNINQLTQIAHRAEQIPVKFEFQKIIDELQAIGKQIVSLQ